MSFMKPLLLVIGLSVAASSFADPRIAPGHSKHHWKHSGHYSSGYRGHDRHHDHDHYRRYDRVYVDGYYDRGRYYERHVHSRHCGHDYRPAFRSRVKVFLDL